MCDNRYICLSSGLYLFVPVDMPLLSPALASILLNKDSSEQAQSDVMRFEKQHFPLLLRNNVKIRQIIARQLLNKELALYQLFKLLTSNLINSTDCDRDFRNFNTPEQWQQLINKV